MNGEIKSMGKKREGKDKKSCVTKVYKAQSAVLPTQGKNLLVISCDILVGTDYVQRMS